MRRIGALDVIAGSYQRAANKVVVLMPGPGMREVFPELPLTAQQWQMLKTMRAGVFVSHLLAEKFALKAGAAFPVTTSGLPRADGANAWSFEVLGVVPDISLLPVGYALGNFDYLDQSRPMGDRGEVQQFWLLAADVSQVDTLMKLIDTAFGNSSVPTRSVSEKALLQGNGGSGSDAIAALMGLASVGVIMIMVVTANAMRHSILERNTELAVLKTLGFSNATIMGLILTEAALPCLSGGLFGLLIAALTAAASPLLLPADVTLPVPQVNFEVVTLGTGAALLIALVAATVPVMRITRLDVAAALARI
ncbi:MAG TPA: ABC transporter permease [Steroidobacteraceae bacterium]|nr:ABC transporter permease [Steroidobacteraceae bacterium]